MRTIHQAVLITISESTVAREAMAAGILNLSAYAKTIKKAVEEQTWKTVQIPTIVVALSRIQEDIKKNTESQAPLYIDDITIKAPLVDITYEKTKETIQAVATIKSLEHSNDVITNTIGSQEITIIASAHMKANILAHFGVKPKAVFDTVSGISMRFSENYIDIPNVLYRLLGIFATKNINVIEIVSTYTELMVVIDPKFVNEAIGQLMKLKA